VARRAQWADDFNLFVPVAYAQGAVYGLGALLLLQREKLAPHRQVSGHVLLGATLAVAIVLRLVAFATPPDFMSTDLYRYVWDGRVQGSGINPYLYVPADPALLRLQDDLIFPYINRADTAPTIYAPFAQLVFFAVTRLGDNVVAMRLGMLAFEAVAVVALILLLRRCGQPLERIALYVWHPLPVWEIASGAHVDAVLVAGVLTALLAAASGRRFLSGTLLAAAALTKFLPLVLVPAIWRRRDWRMPMGFVAVATLLYAVYAGWDSAGWRVLGFLPGYAAEEGLAQGGGILFVSLLHQAGLAPLAAKLGFAAVAAATLGALAAAALRQGGGTQEMLGFAAALVVATLVLISPHYPWYFCWIVAFIPFFPRASLIYLTVAVFYIYVTEDPASLWTGLVIYGPFAALLAAEQARSLSPRLQEGPVS
jgi:hypothetical protein